MLPILWKISEAVAVHKVEKERFLLEQNLISLPESGAKRFRETMVLLVLCRH